MDAAIFEKLGVFYLGRPIDRETGQVGLEPLLYDSRDLLTHAVCVGMTGSGKTGLCIGLIEEAAIDGVPALVIDPKGDLGNLLLTFPRLEPRDFEPWVNRDEARRAERSVAEFAAEQAELWRHGLADWGQDGARIQRLREAADFAIFTPGSDAGLPISVLSSFKAPSPEIRVEGDLFGERVSTTVSGLLGLVGVEADPIQGREHILLAHLLDHFWRQGQDVGLPTLIRAVQDPPFRQVGVLDVETFFPAKERLGLVMAINNLLASPGFQGWLVGVPLDIDRLLYTETGRPRVAVLSIAHLADSERMFFVSLLLNELIGWMRRRSGTTSLRTLLYMDEVFGFMPPVGEPPSKRPLLTLLKQARAYGVGVVLSTQNPMDLDYKGLSNAGTWFIGRLQTERDKLRMLEGLEGIQVDRGCDRRSLDRLISGLGKRVFLLHNVHEPEPRLFRTRWALSYLAGPLTRQQIGRLMADRKGAIDDSEATGSARGALASTGRPGARPLVEPGVEEVFIEPTASALDQPVYRPALLGEARIHFVDRRSQLEIAVEEPQLVLPLDEDRVEIDWALAADRIIPEQERSAHPRTGAGWLGLPAAAGKAKSHAAWRRQLHEHLFRTHRLELFRSPAYGVESRAGESERDFRIRLAELARESRDREVEKLRESYARKAATLDERLRRARARVDKEREQAGGQKLQSAISIGTALLAVLTGRKGVSRTDVGRVGTALRGVGRASEQVKDVERAEETVEALSEQLDELNVELSKKIVEIEGRFDAASEQLTRTAVRPRKADIDVRRVALLWIPESRPAS